MASRIMHFSDKGAQDLVELTGSQGFVGNNEPWTTCGVITFQDNQACLSNKDRAVILQIIPLLMTVPLPQTAVDGFRDPNNQDLSDQRSRAVQSALVLAGVEPERISIGAFGDPKLCRVGRVEVLFRPALARSEKIIT